MTSHGVEWVCLHPCQPMAQSESLTSGEMSMSRNPSISSNRVLRLRPASTFGSEHLLQMYAT